MSATGEWNWRRSGIRTKRSRAAKLSGKKAPPLPRRPGHAARAPVRGARRLGFERPDDDLLDPVVADPARGSASRLLREAAQTMRGEPLAPRPHGLPRYAHGGRDRTVAEPIGGAQHDVGAIVRRRHPTSEVFALIGAEFDRAGPSRRHGNLPNHLTLSKDHGSIPMARYFRYRTLLKGRPVGSRRRVSVASFWMSVVMANGPRNGRRLARDRRRRGEEMNRLQPPRSCRSCQPKARA